MQILTLYGKVDHPAQGLRITESDFVGCFQTEITKRQSEPDSHNHEHSSPCRAGNGGEKMEIRNEIKSYIVREGYTLSEVVEILADEYGWSTSVPNLSGKLRRGSLRYREAIELANVLGYDLVWQKRKHE